MLAFTPLNFKFNNIIKTQNVYQNALSQNTLQLKNLQKDTFEKSAVSIPISTQNLSFTGSQTTENGKFLRKLEGIRDPYSGVILLTNDQMLNITKGVNHQRSTRGKLHIIGQYENSMLPVEKVIYNLCKDINKKDKYIPLNDILDLHSPHAIKGLIKQQTKIFEEIKDKSVDLSEEKQKKITMILKNAQKKIKKPDTDDDHFKRRPFISELIHISEEDNLKIIRENILKISDTKDKVEALNQLHKTIVDFNTQPFDKNVGSGRTPIDGIRIMQAKYAPETLTQPNKMEPIIELANKLPTSKNNVNAFIIKYKDRSENEIANRLLNQSIITIEHIEPHSLGGDDDVPNFMPASKARNEERGNMPVKDFMKKYPDIPQHCKEFAEDIISAGNNKKLKQYEWYPYVFKDTCKEKFGVDIDLSQYKINKKDAFKTFPERLKRKYPQYSSV